MATQETIRDVTLRNVKLLERRPDRGHLTGSTSARVEGGFRCVIQDGPWTFAADMPAKAGGEESAPTPGALGRGALASCLAVGIVSWAARREIPLDAVQVDVRTRFDARGELGMDDSILPGYDDVYYEIAIESSAPAEEIADLVATADRYSPYVDVFARGLTMRRVLRLNGEEV